MYLKQLQENWNTFGEEDAMWAVCSTPEKKHNQWDKKEFFATGVQCVSQLEAWMKTNGLPEHQKTALDFGCGVGRLTQALCAHFDCCVGVDIALSMIKQAKQLNQQGKRCVYRLNESDDLRVFPDKSYDLVYTQHVLQHIHPQVALKYIAEFIRILRPGGLACFHCPSAAATHAYPQEGITCSLDTTVSDITMEHMSLATIPVRVTNTCTHPIGTDQSTSAPARIWHHWVNQTTGELHQMHGYTNVPTTIIGQGESLEFDYKAASPPTPDNYELVLTPTSFFNVPLTDSVSDLITVSVEVTPQAEKDTAPKARISSAKRPRSESHAIPIEAVTRVIELAGGRLVDVESSQAHPGAVVKTLYYATRR
ncbi:class I SAM-dependent methyltransferase [uncultured Pseudodesulfovibrio sp.]|uniref:class I SAM-dependent methyltransferase n=1 Tax=uncultured Pseudodesulfovibrio sp. TaxID=2035858 RepID=UPI0029C8F6FB|nr:class I SAM-dependent methyltransferase [uncultured Pseudodesulfovibrio sp.]